MREQIPSSPPAQLHNSYDNYVTITMTLNDTDTSLIGDRFFVDFTSTSNDWPGETAFFTVEVDDQRLKTYGSSEYDAIPVTSLPFEHNGACKPKGVGNLYWWQKADIILSWFDRSGLCVVV